MLSLKLCLSLEQWRRSEAWRFPSRYDERERSSVGRGRKKSLRKLLWNIPSDLPTKETMDKVVADCGVVYNDDYYKYGPYGPYKWRSLLDEEPEESVYTDEEYEAFDKFDQVRIYNHKLEMMDESVGIKYFFVFARSTRSVGDHVPWKEWTLVAEVAVESSEVLDKLKLGAEIDIRARHAVTRCVAWARPDLIYVKKPAYEVRYEPQDDFILGLLDLVDPETEMQGIVGKDSEQKKKQTYYYKLCEKLGVQPTASEEEILSAYGNLEEKRRLLVVEHMFNVPSVQFFTPFTEERRDMERCEAVKKGRIERQRGKGSAEKRNEVDLRDKVKALRRKPVKHGFFGRKGNPLKRKSLTWREREYWKAVLPSPQEIKRIPWELYPRHFDHYYSEPKDWIFEPETGIKATARPFTYLELLEEIAFFRHQYACLQLR